MIKLTDDPRAPRALIASSRIRGCRCYEAGPTTSLGIVQAKDLLDVYLAGDKS